MTILFLKPMFSVVIDASLSLNNFRRLFYSDGSIGRICIKRRFSSLFSQTRILQSC